MVKKSLALLLPGLLLLASGFAEGDLSMELNINNLILRTRTADTEKTEYWGWMSSGSSAFSFKSAGNRNVKADLAFSFIFPEQAIAAGLDMPLITLDRAYIKARFPEFRITAGKTRLGWGDGFVFNSGDVIFGSTDTGVDLTSAEIRSETKWLTSVNVPLGRFSFIEAALIAPEIAPLGSSPLGRIENFGAGGRFYTKIFEIKLEGGYFFDNSEAELIHKPYLALQGNLLADWYLSSSAEITGTGDTLEIFKETLNLTAGLFYPLQINSISSLSVRLEGLCRPFSSWTEEAPSGGEPFSDYAILLYPEIGYSPADSISLSIRSIFSPIDLSAMITAGGSWNVFEGFSINCYAVFHAGDEDDLFALSREAALWQPGADIIDGTAFTIGINYIY